MKNKSMFIMVAAVVFALMSLIGGVQSVQAAPKTIELSFAHTIPPVIPMAKIYQGWAGQVAERSGGRVKINFFWSESLLKASEFFRGVQSGTADMTYYALGLDYGLMPLNMGTKLAFMGYRNTFEGAAIYNKIYNQFPEIRAEYRGLKVLSARMGPAYQLHFTKKSVRAPADLKGMKLISVGGSFAAEMAVIGAAPIDVKVGDLFTALDRGMADGISCHFPILQAFGILKLAPNHTVFEGGHTMGPDMVLFNQKSWNKLPADIQKIFEDLSPWLGQELMKGDVGYEGMVMGLAKKEGHNFISLTPKERQTWIDAVQPVHQKWIADTEAKGLPARAVYDEIKRLIAAMKK